MTLVLATVEVKGTLKKRSQSRLAVTFTSLMTGCGFGGQQGAAKSCDSQIDARHRVLPCLR
jgi:hypothetical protein